MAHIIPPQLAPQSQPQPARKCARKPPVRPATPVHLAPSITKPGIAPGWSVIDEEAYHADPCPAPSLSSHIAMQIIQKSLAHAWRAHPHSPDYSPLVLGSGADRGSAAHALLLGGRDIAPIAADDFRTQAARQARDAARSAGQIPILEKEVSALEAMMAPARQRFMELHEGPYRCEQTAIWRHAAGWRRARLDTLSHCRTLIVDYKTTEAAVDAHACERRIADNGLHIQAAAYVDAVESLHPELVGRVRFLFQWQEQKAPFALSPPIEMTEAFLSLGREQWRAAGRLWDDALQRCTFPAYPNRPHLACPPPWELTRWEERVHADHRLAGEGDAA
jgi:hypothetical protein